MNIQLFAGDVIAIWAAQLKVVSIPALIVGPRSAAPCADGLHACWSAMLLLSASFVSFLTPISFITQWVRAN